MSNLFVTDSILPGNELRKELIAKYSPTPEIGMLQREIRVFGIKKGLPVISICMIAV